MDNTAKTRVLRLDTSIASNLTLDQQIVLGCDAQLKEGFKLATMILVSDDLVLTFQNVDNFNPPKPPTT